MSSRVRTAKSARVTDRRASPDAGEGVYAAIEDAVLASADAVTARAEAGWAAEWEMAAGVAYEAARQAAAKAAQRAQAAVEAEATATARSGTEAAETCNPPGLLDEAEFPNALRRSERAHIATQTAVVMAAASVGLGTETTAVASTAEQARAVTRAIVEDETTGRLAAISAAYAVAAAAAAGLYDARTFGENESGNEAAYAAAAALRAAAAGLATEDVRRMANPTTASPAAAPARVESPPATSAGTPRPATLGDDPLMTLYAALADLHDDARSEWGAALAEPVISWPADALDDLDLPAPVPGVSALMRDLTIARRMEALLSESYHDLRRAFEKAPTALMVADLVEGHPSRFRRVNRALCALTGYSEADLLAADPCDLLHLEEQGKDSRPLQRLVETKAGGYDEVRKWIHADGSEIWVRAQLSTAVDSADGLHYLVGQLEDVTATVAAEAALRHSEERFRLAFRAAPIAHMMIDISSPAPGRLLVVNAATTRLTGHTESQLQTLTFADLHHVRDRPAVEADLRRLISGDVSRLVGEGHYRHVEGRAVPGRLTAALVRDADGRPQYVLAQVTPLDPDAC